MIMDEADYVMRVSKIVEFVGGTTDWMERRSGFDEIEMRKEPLPEEAIYDAIQSLYANPEFTSGWDDGLLWEFVEASRNSDSELSRPGAFAVHAKYPNYDAAEICLATEPIPGFMGGISEG